MKFESKAQQETYEKIEPWMKELFGQFVTTDADQPLFWVNIGSTWVGVGVMPWADNGSIIFARANVVSGANLNQDLLQYLLNQNDHMYFGGFGIDDAGDIFFQHTIIGNTAQKEELRATATSVVLMADKFDDQIVNAWGGQRMLEMEFAAVEAKHQQRKRAKPKSEPKTEMRHEPKM
jgi:hypothetical protein